VDLVILAIVGIAVLRGLFRGLVREALSIGSLAAACIAVRLLTAPASARLVALSEGEIGPATAPWIAGTLIALATFLLGALAARVLRGGARAVGLGWADHAGGALLGAAEGLLVAIVLLLVVSSLLGPAHPFLEGSRSQAALAEIERTAAESDGTRDVAAPPRAP
jgi:membrane protein required for colicin V production